MTTAGDFKIVIQNNTGVEVRASKFEYRDGTKSKTENIFGPLGSTTIKDGAHKDYTRNLQGIGNESTEFTVTYQKRSGTNNWSANHVKTTDTFTCQDNESYTVVLTD
jgi:hypothetical protein